MNHNIEVAEILTEVVKHFKREEMTKQQRYQLEELVSKIVNLKEKLESDK
jgi:hypothetical protein